MVILVRDRILDSIEAYFALSPHMLELALDVPSPDGDQAVARVSVRAARETMSNLDIPTRERDALWALLLDLARQEKDPWDVVAIWMMIPGLRKIVWRCHRYRSPLGLAELETEAVGAFIEAVQVADLDRQELGRWLWWTTYRRVQSALSRLRQETPTADIELVGALESSPYDISRTRTEFPRQADEPASTTGPASGRDPIRVEGERLGAVAARLGLKPALRAGDRRTGEEAA